MYSNVSCDGRVHCVQPQQIYNFCSYETEMTSSAHGGGYNAYFGAPNQHIASSSNPNFVPLGSGHNFPLSHHAQHSSADTSNPNFIPLGSDRCFPPNEQQQQHQQDSAVVFYENLAERQKTGRKRRGGKRNGLPTHLDNNGIFEHTNYNAGAAENYGDGCHQWDDGWGGQQHFEYYETAPNYGQYGVEPSQNYEDYEAYFDSYENGTGQPKERWWHKREQRRQQFFCDTCKIICEGPMNYRAHLEGKMHHRKLEMQQMNADCDQQNCAFRCELCLVFSNKRENFEAHVNGQKHQKKLKLATMKGEPIPQISAIPSDSPSSPNSAQPTGANGPSCGSIPCPMAPFSSLPESSRQLNDRCVCEKIAQIELGSDELRDAEHLVQRVEKALLTVSTFLTENSAVDGAEGPKRLLRGIMRVGLMAKQQLLKSDRRADLVLLCSIVPTVGLLASVVALFRQEINRDTEPYVYVVEKMSESALFISQIGVSVDVFVTLTCSAMRQWSPGDFNFYPYEEPPNALPSGPCLRALAEMRRTKFYQVKCAPLMPMGSLVKILRDIKHRVPAWQVLTDWMVELIVEKVLSTNGKCGELSPGDALFVLFNAISEGSILGKGYSLVDPCEKLPTDALAAVSDKDRLNIYNSARYAIRQIKGNKMTKLLALDGSSGVPSEHPKKRKKTMGQNERMHVGESPFPLHPTPAVAFGGPPFPMGAWEEAAIW